MPKFKVTAPDGSTFNVNAPEGATEEEAILYVQQKFYTGKESAPAAPPFGTTGPMPRAPAANAQAPAAPVLTPQQRQAVAQRESERGFFGRAFDKLMGNEIEAPAAYSPRELAQRQKEITAKRKELAARAAEYDKLAIRAAKEYQNPNASDRAAGLAQRAQAARNEAAALARELETITKTGLKVPEAQTTREVIGALPREFVGGLGAIPGGIVQLLGTGLEAAGVDAKGITETGRGMRQGVRETVEDIFGAPGEALQYDPASQLAADVSGGVGSIGSFLVPGSVAKLAGVGKGLTGAERAAEVARVARPYEYGIGTAQGLEQGIQDVEATEARTGEAVSSGRAFAAYLLNAGLGATEVGVASRIFERIPVAKRGAALDAVSNVVRRGTAGRVDPTAIGQAVARTLTDIESRALGRVGVRGTEEALQEAGVQMGTNVIAKGLYDDERGITEGAGYAGLVGGIVGGGLRGATEGVLKLAGKPAAALGDELTASPAVQQEFQRLAMEAVGQVMAANPGMARAQAVAVVEQNAERLLLRAKANVLGAGEEDTNVDTGMDVSGAGGAGVAPNRQPGAAPTGPGELGAVNAGRVGEPVSGVPVSDVGAGAGIPALDLTDFAPTIAAIQEAPDNKTRKPLAMQLVSDVVQSTPELQGLGPKAYTQAANQIVLAAARGTAFDPVAIVAGVAPKPKAAPTPKKVPAPEVAPTALPKDERGFPIKPKFTLVTGVEEEAAPAPTVAETATTEKVAPPAQKTMNDLAGAGTVNPENTNEVLVQGGGIQLTPVADDVVQLDSLRAVETGGGRKAMQQLVQAADQNGTAIQLSPEPFAAPAGKEMSPTELAEWYKGFGFQEQPDGSMVRPAAAPPSTITPEPQYTPQQIAENLDSFAMSEAQDRGLDPGMFREGAVDIQRGREPLTDQQILDAQGPEYLDAYKQGMQWAQDRIAEAAKSTATEADIDPVILAKRDELREKIMAAPGDTIRQKIIGLMSKETNAALKAAKTPEELAKLLGLDETSPIMDEVLRGEAGIDDKRMKDILRNLYQGSPDQMAHICVKEILQNSHDAVRDALRMGLITEGNISFQVSEDGLTFTTTDNGKGMSPQVLQGPFLKVGSTGKGAEGESHSGGYGLAKTLFLYGNKAIKVITANNGIVSTMETSGEELGKAFVTRDPNDQPLIYTRPFEPADYDIFPEGHGTKLTLTLPSQDIDPEAGKPVDVKPLPDYPGVASLPGMAYSPLFSPVNVTYQKEGDIEYRVDIGSRFPYADFAEFAQVELPSGTAVIYASRQPKKYGGMDDNVHILSDGVWQFSKGINVPGSYWDKIPYDFYINYIADPSVKPDNPLYPFSMDRKTFSAAGEKTYNNLAAILLNNYGLEDLYKDAKSFGTIQYFDPDTLTLGAVIDLTPEIPEVETGFGKLQGGAEIVLGSDGRVAINGQEVNPENISDISSKLPKSSSLVIDQNKIDPNKVMVHENADVVYTDKDGVEREVPIMEFLRETFGTKVDEFYYFMGDAFQQLRNEVADIMDYPALKTEAVGISVDPGYRGVSIKVPFSGMFINPLVPEAPAGPRALFGIVTTMIHELAHFKVRNHDAGFPAEMQRIQAALEASAFEQGFDFSAWKQRFVERAIDAGYIDLIRAGQDLFETRKDRESYTYGNPEYKNVRVVYRGQRFKDGAAEQVPDEGGAGLDGTPDTGAVGAGEGAGERLLGPAYEGREGAGGRRQPEGGQGGTEPLTEENVDKAVSVKLTKAQMRRLEAAAGLRRKDLNNMQKRIVQSRNDNEMKGLINRLTRIARDPDSDSGILASLTRSLPPGAYRILLGFQQIEDVFRLGRIAGIKTLDKLDTMFRDGYMPYVNQIMKAANKVSTMWMDFASRDPAGNTALDDVIMVANMLDADPSTALVAADYMRSDPMLKDLQDQLAKETNANKKKSLQGQITSRKNDIQRLYFGGALRDKNNNVVKDEAGNPVVVRGWNDVPPEGRRIFKAARDFHRATFKEHYRLLMQRIDDAKLDPADAVQLKTSIENMFAKAAERTIYFPVKRFGEYWLSVGNDFYMRESTQELEALKRRLKKEGETRPISTGTKRDGLREKVTNQDAGKALKGILDLLDTSSSGGQIPDIADLKDMIFQMYLTSLPEADMRSRFIHRKFVTGFSTDAARTFASTAVASSNQLGRLAYNYKFDNLIEEAKAETEEQEMKPWLDTITAEVDSKIKSLVTPDPHSIIDMLNAFGAKLNFLWHLSAPSSALINFTQLHIVGLPVLSAEFGEAKTAAMATRYTTSFFAGREIPNPIRDEDGNVKLQTPEFHFQNSGYMRSLKKSDPERYKQTLEAWEYANDREVIQNTLSASSNVYESSVKPTSNYNIRQALRRGDVGTATKKAIANSIDAMGYLFHTTEKIARSIMYMSSFDLAYERAIAQGKSPEQAGKEARELAVSLTNKAMFDFSNWNKSRFAQSRLGRIPLQMTQYMQAITSLMVRSFAGMLPYFNKEGKVASARIFFGVTGMTMLYGGIRGTQLWALATAAYTMLKWAESLLDDDDEEKKAKEGAQGYLDQNTIEREIFKYADEHGHELGRKDIDYFLRAEWIPDFFGQGGTMQKKLNLSDDMAAKLGKAADMGIPAAFGVDISGSVSLGDMWHPVDLKGNTPEVRAYEAVARRMLGPFGSVMVAPAKFMDAVNNGDIDGAVELMTPAAIRNYLKAQRLQEKGLQIGKEKDIQIKDPSYYTPAKVFLQMLGFRDAETSRDMQLDIMAGDIEKGIANEKTKLFDRRYKALLAYEQNPTPENEKKLNIVERDIEVYNLNYPSNSIGKEAKQRSYEEKARDAREKAYGLGINEKIPVREPTMEERLKRPEE